MDISNVLPNVRGQYKFNEPLSRYTWLNVGGPADVIFFPQDIDDLQFFMQNKPQNVPVFILGGGANLLVRDGGIRGVVIKLSSQNFSKLKIEDKQVICGAGLLNSSLKKEVASKGLGGLEFICSIPGCVGGAVCSNAGCFGREISDILVSAKVMDVSGNIFDVKNDDFHFAYRYSNFPSDWIILEVCLAYEKKMPEESIAVISHNDKYRRTHQPIGIRTAGSTFKNPPQMKAWELIKNSGADKIVVGGARLSPQHCNFLENDGTASATDIETLCNEIIKKVKEQQGIELVLEIKKVGEGE